MKHLSSSGRKNDRFSDLGCSQRRPQFLVIAFANNLYHHLSLLHLELWLVGETRYGTSKLNRMLTFTPNCLLFIRLTGSETNTDSRLTTVAIHRGPAAQRCRNEEAFWKGNLHFLYTLAILSIRYFLRCGGSIGEETRTSSSATRNLSKRSW